MAKAAAARKSPRSHGGTGWLGGIACGVLLAVTPNTAVLLGGSLLPGVVGWVLLPDRPRRAAPAMLLFGLAMSVDRLPLLWNGAGGLAAAWDLLMDPLPLLMAWFAAAFGWALTELLPAAIGAMLEFEAQRQSLSLRKARRRAVEGWDLGDSS